MRPVPPATPTRWCASLADFADACDGYAIDQFGVLHDGHRAYPGAADALQTLRERGKRVIVLSNSGKRADANAERLARFGVDGDCYDELLTSGELAWRLLAAHNRPPFDRLGTTVLMLHPEADRALIADLPLHETGDPRHADFLLLASLGEEHTIDSLEPLLHRAAAAGLPLVCANPDRLRLTAAGVAPSSGSVAARYEEFGGRVVWIGKPHPLIYAACRASFEAWGATRLCALGDSLEHDVAGGAAAGFATCFIAGGLHARQFEAAGTAGRDAQLARLLVTPHAAAVPAPTWALPTLRW